MGEYVIFAIDNDGDLHTNAKFLRYIDERQVMGKMKGKMQLCIGSYKDQLERSYIMRCDDFAEHVARSGYVDNQESFLVIRDGYYGKVYATLKYQGDDGVNMYDAKGDAFLGVLKPVGRYEATLYDGWTYRPDYDQYYVVVPVNDFGEFEHNTFDKFETA